MNQVCHTVIFSDKAYNAIIDETFRKNPIETGGILLGHVFDNGIWVVMEVIPPGIDSVHQYAYFEYDEKFVNYLAESVATKYENKLELLGLWHRHPGSMDTFSGTDDGTNRIFACLRSCGAISGLVNVDPNFRLTMRHVSTPLHYEIVDVEVGDDLIPEDYFKLRHFPEKGLNPSPDLEKKNELRSTDNTSVRKSNSTNESMVIRKKTTDKKTMKTTVLVLLSIFFVGLFTIFQTSQNIVGNNAYKQGVLFELVYNSSGDDGICIREAKEAKIDIDNKGSKVTVVREAKPALYIKPRTAINLCKYSFLAISVLLVGLIFVSLERKEYIYCGIGSYALATVVALISPIKLSLAFFALIILLGLILSLMSIGIFNLVEYVKAYQNLPWFQRRKDLLLDEDESIRQIESNAERSYEGGKLVYTIITDRHITRQEHALAFQMVFSSDYLKTKEIRIYLIMPDLDDMFTVENGLSSSFVRTDKNGDKYLDFTGEGTYTNGASMIKILYEWVDLYNRCRAGEIPVDHNKL